jgi:SNF2 family DNA or RNA helicase
MGLGKTVSVLTAIDLLSLTEDNGLALVVAPLLVAQNTWPDEARKWDHLKGIRVSVCCGTESERIAALRADANVYTINYENAPWLVEHLESKKRTWPFSHVISDESTKLKGFRLRQGTRRARALGRIAHRFAKRWTNMTGTPAPNGLQDLWGQAWFLDAGARLGRTHDSFVQRWFRPKFDGYGAEPLPFAKEQIEDKLRDICLTLNVKDWFDLREPIVNVIKVQLPAKARRAYREMEREMYLAIGDSEIEAFNAASRTVKCLQLANGAIYASDREDELSASPRFHEVHDVKLQALESVIEEAAGMPVLVVYQFKSDLARLKVAFPKGRALDKNPQTIRDWNAGNVPVMFVHPASAGHGLNLQDGGNIIAFFGLWWDLEQHQQVIERIGPVRQMQSGHDRPVFIHYIVAEDTEDERVMLRLDSKRSVQDLFMEAMKEYRSAA